MTKRSLDGAEWIAERFAWTPDEDLRDIVFRTGVIVWAFSTIDYTLSELAFRASNHPDYIGVRDSYPASIEGRIKYWTALLNRPGPLRRYRKLGEPFLERYRKLRDLRHMMAHARLSPVLDHWVQYDRINRQPNGEVVYEYVRHTPADLRSKAASAARLSRICRRLYWRINRLDLLPRPDAMTQPP